MTKKIGRNDPCPCGSGKKFKHCCLLYEQSIDYSEEKVRALLQSSGLNAPKVKAYAEKHDCAPLMDYLIALQMNPQNHGKNLRLEHIAQLVVSSLGKSHERPNLNVFKKLIDEEYPYDVMEDIPVNMYAETVLFHGGNYIFFPGLSTDATELFCSMTEAIFHGHHGLSEQFCNEISQGVTLLLKLSGYVARSANVGGRIRGNENPREIISEPQSNQTYAISEQVMTKILNYNELNRQALDSYVLENNEPNLLTENEEENPLLYRPIVLYKGNYYVVGILNQGCAINNFIIKTAVNHNCLDELVRYTQLGIWMRIGSSCCDFLHWRPDFCCDLLCADENCHEELFQIDVNWLAYVCYAKDAFNDAPIDGNVRYVEKDLSSHIETTLAALKRDERTKEFHIFVLVLYSSMGESMMLRINEQSDSDYLLLFSAFDFLQLVQTEEWDNMSLVRYARTKKVHQYLNAPTNQEIDAYSIYKQKGECFYLGDGTPPTFVTFMPNDGRSLIFESKEKLDCHGALISLNGGHAYIPVQRDLNYENIYRPSQSHINAKCCLSYPIPVWVRCSQTKIEDIVSFSIVDTTITAIAFWMNVLRPSIEGLLTERYKDLVEIELLLDEDVLADQKISSEEAHPVGYDSMTVTSKNSGVTVFMDFNFILSFMGANNGSEREMMKRIIIEILDIDSIEAQGIIDKRIPYGPAKMILMTDSSNNPIASPIRLLPPINIHSATNQLLLDQFPEWMKEKGYNLQGKIMQKEDKIRFLHTAVDVLLDVLSEKMSVFDTLSLLKRLIINYETLLFRRNHNEIIQPAQILCFGDSQKKREDFFKEENRLTDAGLSTRALIEYIAATQETSGHQQPGDDDIERLMAIMCELAKVGGICDAIYYEVADHTIEMLTSGRYAIYDDDFNDSVGDFANALSEENVNRFVENFGNKLNTLSDRSTDEDTGQDNELKYINDAFLADWGVSYSDILEFLHACHLVAFNRQQSVIDIPMDELVKEIQSHYLGLSEGVVKKCMDKLSLDKRQTYLTPPDGMKEREIVPWHYNRELSFLRRPIVRFEMPNQQIHCVFGMRSCLMAGLRLSDLLHSGRLKYAGEKIEKLLGYFETKKGNEFNEVVRKCLQQISGLQVWPYGVSIKPKGNLLADDDYGDIDVMAYSPSKNVLYSIECKNTYSAKNVREMKTEMDEYLGRGESPEKDQKKALVLKHLRRHCWIQSHLDQMISFIGVSSAPLVKSMMLTATVIPTSYLKKETIPLSILNFQELKLKGLDYLDTSKEPDVSALS